MKVVSTLMAAVVDGLGRVFGFNKPEIALKRSQKEGEGEKRETGPFPTPVGHAQGFDKSEEVRPRRMMSGRH